jgi:glycosyltransferase involved in cell wall biosynthesis
MQTASSSSDDGSTDNTKGVVAKYKSAVNYLRQDNQGKAAALNLGIEGAKGDTIIILDDDDLFPLWNLVKHAEAVLQAPNADFAFGRFVRFKGSGPPSPFDLLDETCAAP